MCDKKKLLPNLPNFHYFSLNRCKFGKVGSSPGIPIFKNILILTQNLIR